ncbi:MAG: hypothetical protein MUC84_04720 [Solirubrobacteraceae bacterium]|jgi:hypothetical protein|nr:hypothetical protein [Solirubrobacteraceae bacterium]
MRPRRLAPLAVLLAGLLPGPATAGAAPAWPEGRPWATVNLCDPADRPGAVGVRAGVPAGPGAQWLRVRAEWWDAVTRAWLPVRSGGDGGWQRLGDGRAGVRGGTTFGFTPPQAGRVLVVRGRVDVQIRRGPKVLRRATLRTSAGDPSRSGGTALAQCFVRR